MTTDLTIYCHKRPKEYQLSSCSWHLNDEKWEVALKVVSDILGYTIEETSWNGEDYYHYSTKCFKLTPAKFEKILVELSFKGITFSVY